MLIFPKLFNSWWTCCIKRNILSLVTLLLTYSAGAWWYKSCHDSNLNGLWYEGGTHSDSGTGASWYAWKGNNYAYKTIYMRISRVPQP